MGYEWMDEWMEFLQEEDGVGVRIGFGGHGRRHGERLGPVDAPDLRRLLVERRRLRDANGGHRGKKEESGLIHV